mmetsp:Transcript_13971/g.58801  ORF Transcript_13971/g.58801 Transcript_13971/m.58801 type:complete len:357 (+) Transcript_13971:1096-2166(+)
MRVARPGRTRRARARRAKLTRPRIRGIRRDDARASLRPLRGVLGRPRVPDGVPGVRQLVGRRAPFRHAVALGDELAARHARHELQELRVAELPLGVRRQRRGEPRGLRRRLRLRRSERRGRHSSCRLLLLPELRRPRVAGARRGILRVFAELRRPRRARRLLDAAELLRPRDVRSRFSPPGSGNRGGGHGNRRVERIPARHAHVREVVHPPGSDGGGGDVSAELEKPPPRIRRRLRRRERRRRERRGADGGPRALDVPRALHSRVARVGTHLHAQRGQRVREPRVHDALARVRVQVPRHDGGSCANHRLLRRRQIQREMRRARGRFRSRTRRRAGTRGVRAGDGGAERARKQGVLR